MASGTPLACVLADVASIAKRGVALACIATDYCSIPIVSRCCAMNAPPSGSCVGQSFATNVSRAYCLDGVRASARRIVFRVKDHRSHCPKAAKGLAGVGVGDGLSKGSICFCRFGCSCFVYPRRSINNGCLSSSSCKSSSAVPADMLHGHLGLLSMLQGGNASRNRGRAFACGRTIGLPCGASFTVSC